MLSYVGHVLLDNRHGLVVNAGVTPASGTAEREAAEILLTGRRRGTLGGDKGYDVPRFVAADRAAGLTPYVARKRKLVEQVFGWLKTVGLMRKLWHRGCERVDWTVTVATAANNLVRLLSRSCSAACKSADGGDGVYRADEVN